MFIYNDREVTKTIELDLSINLDPLNGAVCFAYGDYSSNEIKVSLSSLIIDAIQELEDDLSKYAERDDFDLAVFKESQKQLDKIIKKIEAYKNENL
jgi:hypothetical protein